MELNGIIKTKNLITQSFIGNKINKMNTMEKIEEIEKLIIKLKKVYTACTCKQEEALVENILDILQINLDYFDDNGVLIIK